MYAREVGYKRSQRHSDEPVGTRSDSQGGAAQQCIRAFSLEEGLALSYNVGHGKMASQTRTAAAGAAVAPTAAVDSSIAVSSVQPLAAPPGDESAGALAVYCCRGEVRSPQQCRWYSILLFPVDTDAMFPQCLAAFCRARALQCRRDCSMSHPTNRPNMSRVVISKGT